MSASWWAGFCPATATIPECCESAPHCAQNGVFEGGGGGVVGVIIELEPPPPHPARLTAKRKRTAKPIGRMFVIARPQLRMRGYLILVVIERLGDDKRR